MARGRESRAGSGSGEARSPLRRRSGRGAGPRGSKAAAAESFDPEYYFWTESLTEEQDGKIERLRKALAAEGYFQLPGGKEMDTRTTLARFLKARGWKHERALEMLQKTTKWRGEYGCTEMPNGYEDFKERDAMLQFYPMYYHMTDKMGRPVYIEELGTVTTADLQKLTTEERMLRYHVGDWEVMRTTRFPAATRAAGREIFTCCTILDLKGLTVRQFDKFVRSYLRKAIGFDQDNYPEHLGTMFIINAPWIFSGMWNFIKALLDAHTVRKIKVLGSDYMGEVTKFIDPENLPERIGGLCKCEGRGGCHVSDRGPWNPQDAGTSHVEFEDTEKGKVKVVYYDAGEGEGGAGEVAPPPAGALFER